MITLTCKDPVIEKHYREVFGKALAQGAISVRQLDALMRKEAQRQEHYDYIHNPVTGRRQVLLDGQGAPRLLYPEIVVTP